MTGSHADIAGLVHRYADAVVHRDADQWAACWAPDARWVLGPGRDVVGRDDILALWKRAMAGFEAVVQHVHNGAVRFDGDTAEGRWHIAEHFRRADGSVGILLAYYDDTYVRVGDDDGGGDDDSGGWRFASRMLVVQYQGPPDLSAPFITPLAVQEPAS